MNTAGEKLTKKLKWVKTKECQSKMYFCTSADKHLSHSVSIVKPFKCHQFNENQGQVMEEKQDGGVEGLEFTSSHKNTKTTTAEQPLTKKTRTYQKRYSTPKDKEEGKMRW